MKKGASLLLAILSLLWQFGFTGVSSAANEPCAPCGKPCECCEDGLESSGCARECSEFEKIQIKVHILNGPDYKSVCNVRDDLGPPTYLDDNGNNVVDYDDLVIELRNLFNTTQSSAITLADVLNRGMKPFLRGDVNGDKLVNANDTAYFTKWYTNKANPAPTCMKAADINDDGKVDSKDYSEFASRVTTGNIPPPFTSAAKDPTPDDLTCGPSIASLMGTAPPPSTTVPPPPSTTSYGN